MTTMKMKNKGNNRWLVSIGILSVIGALYGVNIYNTKLVVLCGIIALGCALVYNALNDKH